MEKITKETLRGWLEDPQVFIMDVRSPQAWEASTAMIKHAHRFDPTQLTTADLKTIPKDKKVVLY
jgi:rhodanese-related sulfurtransferase